MTQFSASSLPRVVDRLLGVKTKTPALEAGPQEDSPDSHTLVDITVVYSHSQSAPQADETQADTLNRPWTQ